MYRFSRHSVYAAALSGALLLSGCKSSSAPTTPPGSAPAGTAAAPAPGSPAAANSAAAPAQPVAVPAAPVPDPPPAPTAPASLPPASANLGTSPAAAAPRPVAARPVVPAGTRLSIRTTQALSASRNEVGDSFSGSLNAPVVVRGAEVFRRGTEVRGTVIAAKQKGRFKGAGALGIELTSVGGYRVTTSEYEPASKGRGKRTAGFIGGGGGVGALIGGLAGGGKGALLGGLAGAGAGTAAGAYTGNRDVIIPAESLISFSTRSTIQVR